MRIHADNDQEIVTVIWNCDVMKRYPVDPGGIRFLVESVSQDWERHYRPRHLTGPANCEACFNAAQSGDVVVEGKYVPDVVSKSTPRIVSVAGQRILNVIDVTSLLVSA